MNLQENISRIKEVMNIISEDEGDIDLENISVVKGTKRPLGLEGVSGALVKELTTLMKTTFSKNNGFVAAANEIESTKKINRKNRSFVKTALYLSLDECRKNSEFNNQKNITFCSDVLEIVGSDNDNRFSDSYGFVGLR